MAQVNYKGPPDWGGYDMNPKDAFSWGKVNQEPSKTDYTVLPDPDADLADQLGVPVCVVRQFRNDHNGGTPLSTAEAQVWAASVGMYEAAHGGWACGKNHFSLIPPSVNPPTPPPSTTPPPSNGGISSDIGLIGEHFSLWARSNPILVGGLGLGVVWMLIGMPLPHRRASRRR